MSSLTPWRQLGITSLDSFGGTSPLRVVHKVRRVSICEFNPEKHAGTHKVGHDTRNYLIRIPAMLSTLSGSGICRFTEFGRIGQLLSSDEPNPALAATDVTKRHEEELGLFKARQAWKNLREERLRHRGCLCRGGKALKGVNITHGGLLDTSP